VAFESDLDRLYLLAFVLTANHRLAEECFLQVLEEVQSDKSVLKPHVSTSLRCRLIKCALVRVFEQPFRRDLRRDGWSENTSVSVYIDTVAQLSDLERFVFVLAVLEGYSSPECSRLLGCNLPTVSGLKARALEKLGTATREVLESSECLRASA
jgi:DNA-binding CsgD family transcriptional regulator